MKAFCDKTFDFKTKIGFKNKFSSLNKIVLKRIIFVPKKLKIKAKCFSKNAKLNQKFELLYTIFASNFGLKQTLKKISVNLIKNLKKVLTN